MRLPLLLLPLLTWACAEGSQPAAPAARPERPAVHGDASAGEASRDAHPALPYRLDRPDAVFELVAELNEISGLAWLPTGRLAAVQDERAQLYELDPATGAVLARTPFGGRGDFEGVAWDGAALWVLESTGTLTRLGEGDTIRQVPTGLHAGCDAEGLAWDPSTSRLLIACKERPSAGVRRARSVHAFDPAAARLDPEPVFTLSRRALDVPGAAFKPSALARHPQSGLWYVASSTTRTVVAVDARGRVRGEGQLPADLAPQPEGLAFAPDGTLYVSSEGRPGLLFRFSPVSSP